MKSQNVFEIFNHFLETKDAVQLLTLSDNLEVFGSATFSDGRTYIGQSAPEKFREFVTLTQRTKQKMNAQVKHALTDDDRGVFFLNISKGKKTSGSALQVVIADGQLKCFHETGTKV